MTDQPSIKPRFLNALTAALKEITPGNGYVSDLADFDPGDGIMQTRVFRGRAWFGENDPIPMVSILEGVTPFGFVDQPPILTANGEYDWPLIVQGFVNDDPVNPTDPAYVLLADVKRRLAQEKTRTGIGNRQPDPFGLGLGKNRVTTFEIGAGVVRPADDVSARAYFWLSLTPRVVENLSDPYA